MKKSHIILMALCLLMSGSVARSSELAARLDPEVQKFSSGQLAQSPFDESTPRKIDSSKTKTRSGDVEVSVGKKSVWTAVLLSAAVPGGGEYYLGKKRKARYFFATEALTWLGFASFKIYGGWRKDDYIHYAAVNASAQLEGKSDGFADLVGFYTDIDEYNTLGRVQDPDRPYLYDTPENHWRWQTLTAQSNYRTIKNQSREAFRRAKFMVGIAAVARLISIVDAVLDTHRINREAETSFSQAEPPVEFQMNPMSATRQISLVIHTNW